MQKSYEQQIRNIASQVSERLFDTLMELVVKTSDQLTSHPQGHGAKDSTKTFLTLLERGRVLFNDLHLFDL